MLWLVPSDKRGFVCAVDGFGYGIGVEVAAHDGTVRKHVAQNTSDNHRLFLLIEHKQ